MKVIIRGFKFMLTEKKQLGVKLFFRATRVNGRIVKSVLCTDWKLIRDNKLTNGSMIEIAAKYTYLVTMVGVVRKEPGRYVIDTDICPICNKPLLQTVDGKDRFCYNDKCGHNDILRLWRFLKYCYYLLDLKYISVYMLYTRHGIKNFDDLYRIRELISENDMVNTPTYEEIANALEGETTVKLSNLYYSLLPDVSIYSAYRLSLCKIQDWKNGVTDLNIINGKRVDDDRLGSLHLVAGELKNYLINPQVKPQMKILAEHITVDDRIDMRIQDMSFRILGTKRAPTTELITLIKLAGGKYERNTPRIDINNINFWIGNNASKRPASVDVNKFIHENKILEILTYREVEKTECENSN